MNINKHPKNFIKRLTMEDWKVLAVLCALKDNQENQVEDENYNFDNLDNIRIEYFSNYNNFDNNNTRVGARVNILNLIPTQVGKYIYAKKIIKTFEILISDYTMEYYSPSSVCKRYDNILQLFLSTKFPEEYTKQLEIYQKQKGALEQDSETSLDESLVQVSKNLLLKLNNKNNFQSTC